MESKHKDDDYFRNSSIIPNGSAEIVNGIENLKIDSGPIIIPFPTLNVFSKLDFDVIELLGKGAYAKVIKALHLKTKEVKAIKIIDRQFIERVDYFNYLIGK
jgi:hypothetical protein